MSETPAPQSMIVTAITNLAGRATLPFQEARAERNAGTAFWYNDLIETRPGQEVIIQYLVTAEAPTRVKLGEWTLRPELCEPERAADSLVMPQFAAKWTELAGLGVAVMPTVDLHTHAERKKWAWTTEEITSGLAATEEDIAALGPEPLPAYVLGHAVTEERRARPQALLPGTVVREDPAGPVVWTGELPEGYAGAPVFAGLPADEEQTKLICLGLALPGEPATVVTFDRLRPAIHALAPARGRRWWQRG